MSLITVIIVVVRFEGWKKIIPGGGIGRRVQELTRGKRTSKKHSRHVGGQFVVLRYQNICSGPGLTPHSR